MQAQPQTSIEKLVRQSGFIRMVSRKGYGFITGDDSVEYFVHFRDMDPPTGFAIGRRVEFSVIPNNSPGRAPVAVRVKEIV